MQRRKLLVLSVIVLLGVMSIAGARFTRQSHPTESLTPRFQSHLRLSEIPFNGQRAYDYMKQICELGPRPTGSPAMNEQQKRLEQFFAKFPCQVLRQEFNYPHPQTGVPVTGCNLIVRWSPERAERILFCCHYDTLPFPLRDPVNRQGRFVGANDGASGVALFMEMANMMESILQKDLTNRGVDFVFLDAEEFMFHENGQFFVGSEYFARQYAQDTQKSYCYVQGILVDMIGDSDLQIYFERYSLSWRDSAPAVRSVWSVAKRLGVKEFIPSAKYHVRDDHLMIRNMGKIPCIDIIDFDYPSWHTTSDVPENCSAESLAKVGWVLTEWLRGQNETRFGIVK